MRECNQYSSFRSVGALNQVVTTTRMVMQPPKTTDGTTPSRRAITPLSNCPSSLLELMNMELTEDTLPRMGSGVFTCTMVPLTTTLIPSSMPLNRSARKESRYHFDNPNTMIQTPKPKTA